MPISNNASYAPTMNEFHAHWTQVDAALGAPLKVVNEVKLSQTLFQFTALRQSITDLANEVVDALNTQEIARGDIELKKAQLLAWFGEFVGLLDAYWVGTKFLNARPMSPTQGMGRRSSWRRCAI